jgi:hypothetical protein
MDKGHQIKEDEWAAQAVVRIPRTFAMRWVDRHRP